MILNDEAISLFKTRLQQSIVVCSERCLFNSVKWAAELVSGIKRTLVDTTSPFRESQGHLSTISIYNNPYETQFPTLTEFEYNKYQNAKALFQMRQFDGVTYLLDDSKSPRLCFLRLYSKYLAGEKRREQSTQDILGATENYREPNAELNSIEKELKLKYENNELDSFSLYLYGIVLRKRDNNVKATIVLLESIRKYEFNWSAWMELALLVKTQKQFNDIRGLLNLNMSTSVIKQFFLAKLCVDLHQPISIFKEIMDPLTEYFPNSPYITSQWAVMFYENMDYNASAILFEDLRSSHPTRLEEMDVYSNLLYLQGSKDQLCMLALECGKVDKYRAETCCVQANYYGSKREMIKSIEYFKRALKLNQSYPLVWTLLGHDFIEENNTAAAIECYRRAVSINSRDFRGWYGLGQAHECINLPYDAIFYYEKATDIRPNDPRMWKALAGCYKGLEREKEMQDCYLKATACDKAEENLAMIQVGNIYEKMGKTDMAINYYHDVWEQMKNSDISSALADISIRLANYAMVQKDYTKAEMYARTALDAEHPYHEMARETLDEIRTCRANAAE